jgi:hypothetical protein
MTVLEQPTIEKERSMTTPDEEKATDSRQSKSGTRPGPQTQESPLGEFLTFRRFATPVLVQIAFWAGVLVFLAVGMNMIEAADRGWQGTNAAMVWSGILTIFLGPVVLRIVGELILVVFRINEQLEEFRTTKE